MTNSNSEAALAGLSADIKRLEEKTKGASLETLEAFRDIGAALGEAKSILGNGKFGKWCEAEGFTFSRTWRAKLMKLAEHWDEIRQAAAETPDKAHEALTVNGAISVWQAWKRAKEGPKDSGGAGGSGEGVGEGSTGKKRKSKTEQLEEEVQRLREQLAEALEEISRLKADKGATGSAKGSTGSNKSRTTGGAKAKAANSNKPSAEDRKRFSKVWNLYQRAGTEGEKQAAKARLDDIARRFGMSYEELCKEFGMPA
jgi:hypothetical protein